MRTFDKPTKIFIPVIMQEDWIKSRGPLALETRVTEASIMNAKKWLDDKEGKKAILELGPASESDLKSGMPWFLMTESDLQCRIGNSIVWEREGKDHPNVLRALCGVNECSYGRMKALQVKRVIYL